MDAAFERGGLVSLDKTSIPRQYEETGDKYYRELYKELLIRFQEGYATSKEVERLAEMHRKGIGTPQDDGYADFFEEKAKQYKEQENIKLQKMLKGMRGL